MRTTADRAAARLTQTEARPSSRARFDSSGTSWPYLWFVRRSASRLLQRVNAFCHVAVINVDRVNLGEALECRVQFARRLLGHTQIIPQCQLTFRVDAEVVMRLQILVLGAHFAKFRAEFVEDFLQWPAFCVCPCG